MPISAYYVAAAQLLATAGAAVARQATPLKSWQVRDTTDGHGQPYVALAMKGGGVRGIALAGHGYVVEQLGGYDLPLGSTSAGSDKALLIAAAGPVQVAKTNWLLEQLRGQHLPAAVNGNKDARDFVRVPVANGPGLRCRRKGAQVPNNSKEVLLRLGCGSPVSGSDTDRFNGLDFSPDAAARHARLAGGPRAVAGFGAPIYWAGYPAGRCQRTTAYRATNAVRPSAVIT